MESGKQEKSETSSEENDRPEQVNDDAGTGRSYECTFCKRGFTNAQALGGHMNIHRKDRAKARQVTGSSVSNKPNEEYMTSKYFAPISSEPAHYYGALEAQRNYHMYFPSSASSPRHPHAYHESDLPAQRSQPLSLYEERLAANLSLRIGPTHMEDSETNKEDVKDDEVDLELRLGHEP